LKSAGARIFLSLKKTTLSVEAQVATGRATAAATEEVVTREATRVTVVTRAATRAAQATAAEAALHTAVVRAVTANQEAATAVKVEHRQEEGRADSQMIGLCSWATSGSTAGKQMSAMSSERISLTQSESECCRIKTANSRVLPSLNSVRKTKLIMPADWMELPWVVPTED